MKIFISYGHNDHAALVDRLFDALLQAGHEPWKDDRYEGSSGIYAGEDFTQVIYDAIDRSDFVVALVSEVTQARPYCRDERQYAYNNKGSRFIQIRLDHVQLRLGNSNSYIDMSDVEACTGAIDEALFQKQLQALFAAFRDPAAFAGDGLNYWAKFEAHLKIPGVMKFHDFVGVLDNTPFVGRQWLREQCVRWVTDNTIDCRLFAILGEAGTGKTAFIRHLAADRELVKSVHVCIYDRPSTRSAKDTLKDLAYILAQNNDTYFNFLKSKNLEPVEDMGVDGLFEFLFIEPLKNEQSKYLLIIDGLDELEETTGLNPLMKLFRQYAQQINPNISFLVTGRPDENILNKLRTIGGGTPPEQVLLDPETSREDLALYIQEQLQALGQYTPTLAKKLLEACDGNFEYLTLLFREASREGLTLTEDMKMPKGLNERYTQYLDRRMEAAQQRPRFTREQRQLLSVLCAAQEPLPLSLLGDITGMDPYDIQDEFSILGSLIRQTGDDDDPMICLFTKSFRDYLLDRSCSAYCVNREQGNEQIALFIMDNCTTEKQLKKYPYLERNAYLHLLIHGDKEEEEILDFLLGQAKEQDIAPRIAGALSKGNPVAIHTYCRLESQLDPLEIVVRYLKSLREKIALSQICAYRESHGERTRALLLHGDIDRMDPSPAAFAQAQARYEEALTLAQAEYASAPDYKTRRTLALSYERLGILAKRDKTPQGIARATDYYRKSLELCEENLALTPCLQTRRDVAVSCDHLGLLSRQTGDAAAAKQYFLRCLELNRQNHEQAPDYHSRRDLMFVYRRLASQAEKSHAEEARQWYLMALEMTRQNYLSIPGFESRRDLSLCYDSLGVLAINNNALEEARDWYLKANELDKENCEENPCYLSREDLAVSYVRLGNLINRSATVQAGAEAEQWYRKAMPLYAQNYADNPCLQTRQKLSTNYCRLATVCRQQNTPQSHAEAEAFLRKSLPLEEESYAQQPCEDTRSRLITVCYQLAMALGRNPAPEAQAQALALLEQHLKLQAEQHRQNPTHQHAVDTLHAYLSLAGVYRRLGHTAQARDTYNTALSWIETLPDSSDKNFGCGSCYEGLRDLEKQLGTPEGDRNAALWQQKLDAMTPKAAEQSTTPTPEDPHQRLERLQAEYEKKPSAWLRSTLIRCHIYLDIKEPESNHLLQALAMAKEDYEKAPSPQKRRELAMVYNALADRAAQENTPAGNEASRGWYEKELALALEAYSQESEPKSHTRIDLVYRNLLALALREAPTDHYARADRLQQERLAFYTRIYEAAPNFANWQQLTELYRELIHYAEEKGTPEGAAQAALWQSDYDRLWKNCPTQA